MNPVVLKIKHGDAWKMTGKVVRIGPTGSWVFLHEESGTQAHKSTSAPCGIDTLVANWLHEHAVDKVHHHIRSQDLTLLARTSDVLEYGIRKFWGERDRLYLNEEYWSHVPPSELTKGYFPSWVTGELLVGPEIVKADISPVALRRRRKSVPNAQLSLLSEEDELATVDPAGVFG